MHLFQEYCLMNFNLCIQPCNFYLSQIIQPPSTDILRPLHRDHSFPKNAECFVLFAKCSFSFLQRGNPLVGPPIPLLYQSCFSLLAPTFYHTCQHNQSLRTLRSQVFSEKKKMLSYMKAKRSHSSLNPFRGEIILNITLKK